MARAADTMSRPAKRTKLLSDAEDSDSDSDSDHGVQLPLNYSKSGTYDFKINSDFAKRFEHNKKREELHQLDEKHNARGNARLSWEANKLEAEQDDDEESSSDESEDDEADLVTADLDDEIMATLQAIKTRDPKVYDSSVKFYSDPGAEGVSENAGEKREKPMYLRDYHRQNLLAGRADGADEDDAAPPQTYQEEQDALKRQLVGEMHATSRAAESGEGLDDDDDFMVAKRKQTHDRLPAAERRDVQLSKKRKITDSDVKAANADPETYLSNFMAAQAWRPADPSKPYASFDSDDSEEEARADAFEEAYNMRFENPALANERLQSFARDVGKYSVRRDEKTGRARQREGDREQKEAAKREREEERARLRKLKIEETEEKVKRIKDAAGLRGQEIDLEQWRDVLEGDFDDDKWEAEMKRRFGDQYYAEQEGADDLGLEIDGAETQRRKVKKPRFDDDIDIEDLVPDFNETDRGKFTLSSDDEEEVDAPIDDDNHGERAADQAHAKPKTKKDRAKAQADAKRVQRKERRKIEELVDSTLPLNHPSIRTAGSSSNAPVTGFRYRETSPTSFGLSARDILFAEDSQLNQYAGLKKMAPFRDGDRKSRDRKKFSKKARLRQWRKETFGKADEPSGGFERVLGEAHAEAEGVSDARREGKKGKGRRRTKNKAKA